ncbi:DUF4440 domain-containing protein [Shewanella sp. OPT22]|nr:DUF4440 domain-containing protein [Shewanella sp. OPT22]
MARSYFDFESKFKGLKLMKEVIQTVIQLEKSLFTDEVRKSTSALNKLIADNFIEVASTGIRFGKVEVLNRLPTEAAFTVESKDFEGRMLSDDNVMLLYQSSFKRDGSEFSDALRCSIWQRNNGQWQMIYHQGTNI